MMLSHSVGKMVKFGVLATLGALALSGAASAKTVVGAYDPLFGPPFNTVGNALGYTADVSFYVPDTCFTGVTSALYVIKSNSCSSSDTNGGISLLSAQVKLYKFAGTGPWDVTAATLLQTLVFASPTGPYTSDLAPDPLNGVVLQLNPGTGKVEGIGASSVVFGGILANADVQAITGVQTFSLRLGPDATYDWDRDTEPVRGDPNELLESGLVTGPAALAEFGMAHLFAQACGDCAPIESTNSATGTFTTVPEPGSMGLAFAAMAAAWLARRPRRA
jgi:hypothetical protein